MKKYISIFMALALAIPMWGCNKKSTDNYTYDSAADFTENDGELFYDVPSDNFDGFSFNILNARTGSSASAMDTDTVSGDILNERLYKRNSNVEERLNIVISEERDTPENIYDNALASCMAGDNKYSAVWNSSSEMAALACSGCLVSSDDLTQIDLSKPWWDTDTMSQSSVQNDYFLFYGDINLSLYDAHSMIGFNVSMLSDFDGVESPYDLVDSGHWTMEKMLELMSAVSGDTDGNAQYTQDDRYGVSVNDEDMFPLLFGCNAKMSEKDDYDFPTVSIDSDEYFYNVMKKISDVFYSDSTYVFNASDSSEASSASMFKSGHSLFYICSVGDLYNLRDMEYEFGVLPLPKYDESQSDYISYMSPHCITALGVLSSSRNLSRTAIILENLAAESYRNNGLASSYLDTVLSFKYVNDEKSRKNLTQILNSGTLDIADIYNWGNVRDILQDICKNITVYSSKLAYSNAGIQSDLIQTLEQLSKY